MNFLGIELTAEQSLSVGQCCAVFFLIAIVYLIVSPMLDRWRLKCKVEQLQHKLESVNNEWNELYQENIFLKGKLGILDAVQEGIISSSDWEEMMTRKRIEEEYEHRRKTQGTRDNSSGDKQE